MSNPVSATNSKLDSGALMRVTARPEVVMQRGDGSWLWDSEGRRYLDFVQGWAVNAFGHAPALIRDALDFQAGQLLTASPAFHNVPAAALCEKLANATGLDRVFLCSTGAEANEGAIKLARKWGRLHRDGAWEVISATNSFHGRTLATMAATGKPGWDDLFPPAMPGFRHVPYGELDAIAAAIGPETVAIMLEPIQGEGGVVVPPDGYFPALRRLTEEKGVLLILDEIQTGLGRTGRFLACMHEAVTPDVLTLGKGLGSGVPLAALIATDAVSCFRDGDQGGTHAGNPLMAAVGNAVVDAILQPEFLTQVNRVAAHLVLALEGLSRVHPIRFVRGRGLLLAVGLGSASAEKIVASCREAGLLLNAPRADLLRFMPALTVTCEEIDFMIEILGEVMGRESR